MFVGVEYSAGVVLVHDGNPNSPTPATSTHSCLQLPFVVLERRSA